ncbi:MAG TPA: MmgE/PrpD family protein [Steroidobacter sp.]
MTISPSSVDVPLTGLDRRSLLKLLGAGVGAAAFTGTTSARDADIRSLGNLGSSGHPLRERLASYVAAARFEHLPPAVIEKAKEQIVFFLGRAFTNVLDPRVRQSIELARQIASRSAQAGLIGDHLRLPTADAALVNAVLFSEPLPLTVLMNEPMHPGVVTLPAALAAGELNRVSGRELVLALAIGYEVFGKLGRATSMTRPARSLVASWAATAVAGRLFQLDRECMIAAFSYAGEPGLESERHVLDTHPGLISRHGIVAASLARARVVESPPSAGREQSIDLPAPIEELGYWEILTTLQRPYRSVGHESPAVEVLMDLMQTHRLSREHVSSIHVVLPSSGSRAQDMQVASRGPFAPACRACASVPYGLARVLADGGIDAVRFANDGLAGDTAMARLMQRIEVAFESGRKTRWVRMTVRTRDGRTLESESDFHTYELPPDRWQHWLRSGGKRLLPASQLRELAQMIRDLEHVDDISKLLALAAPAHAGARA